MKIKDLNKEVNLVGMKVILTDSDVLEYDLPANEMVISSGWGKGLWLKVDDSHVRAYPYTGDYSELEVEETIISLLSDFPFKPHGEDNER